MNGPLVTVVCLCYNHERFVEEALASVFAQTYSPIQLVVIDDASTDGSAEVISRVLAGRPEVVFLSLKENHGNCRAFNQALPHIRGEYVIDLAADDILLPERVSVGVRLLTEKGAAYGVTFSDAEWIDEEGRLLHRQSDRFPHATVPEGDIYRDLIQRYFICSPTMMFRKSVLDRLNGYDVTLAYEDFDFWIRSSRFTKYCYSPDVLVKKRVVKNSMAARQFRRNSEQLVSTLTVCRKILALNRTAEERTALRKRIRYEIGVALRLARMGLVVRYVRLYGKAFR